MRHPCSLLAAMPILALVAWMAWADAPSQANLPRREFHFGPQSLQPAVRWTEIDSRSPRVVRSAAHARTVERRESGQERPASRFAFRGARSCAATACHGDADAPAAPSAAWRRSYITWIERDPHAQAHAALEGAAGRQMLERLAIAAGGKIFDPVGYANCAACHDPPLDASQRPFALPPLAQHRPFDATALTAFRREGVSCEHCHGAADGWISQHHTHEANRAELAALGMTATRDLAVRARLCATCHVGAPGQEVNHDLLAAGHPPLKYEFSAYLDRLPKHWNAHRERVLHRDFELNVWLAGQAASADAALRVLETRARRAAQNPNKAPWPEFAEYDCFACHHALAPENWRPERGADRRRLGVPAWGTWHFPMFQRLPISLPSRASPAIAVASLRELLETEAPNPTAVQRAVAELRTSYHAEALAPEAVLESLAIKDDNARDDASRLDPALLADWDRAAQAYLAMVAVDRAYRDELAKRRIAPTAFDRRLTADLEDVRRALAWQRGAESPTALPADATISLVNNVFARLKQRAARRREVGL